MNEQKIYCQSLLDMVLSANLNDSFKTITDSLIKLNNEIKTAYEYELSILVHDVKALFYLTAYSSEHPLLREKLNEKAFYDFLDRNTPPKFLHEKLESYFRVEEYTIRHRLALHAASYENHYHILYDNNIFPPKFFFEEFNGHQFFITIDILKEIYFTAIKKRNYNLLRDNKFFERVFNKADELEIKLKAMEIGIEYNNTQFLIENFSQQILAVQGVPDAQILQFQLQIVKNALDYERFDLLAENSLITEKFLDTAIPRAPEGSNFRFYLFTKVLDYSGADSIIPSLFTENFLISPHPLHPHDTIRISLLLKILKGKADTRLLSNENLFPIQFLDSKFPKEPELTNRDVIVNNGLSQNNLKVFLEYKLFPEGYLDKKILDEKHTQRSLIFFNAMRYNWTTLFTNEKIFPESFWNALSSDNKEIERTNLDELFRKAIFKETISDPRLKKQYFKLLLNKKLFPDSYLDSTFKSRESSKITNRQVLLEIALEDIQKNKSTPLLEHREPLGKLLSNESPDRRGFIYEAQKAFIIKAVTQMSSSTMKEKNIERILNYLKEKDIHFESVEDDKFKELLEELRTHRFTSAIDFDELGLDNDAVHFQAHSNKKMQGHDYKPKEFLEAMETTKGFCPYTMEPVFPEDIKAGYSPQTLEEAIDKSLAALQKKAADELAALKEAAELEAFEANPPTLGNFPKEKILEKNSSNLNDPSDPLDKTVSAPRNSVVKNFLSSVGSFFQKQLGTHLNKSNNNKDKKDKNDKNDKNDDHDIKIGRNPNN